MSNSAHQELRKDLDQKFDQLKHRLDHFDLRFDQLDQKLDLALKLIHVHVANPSAHPRR